VSRVVVRDSEVPISACFHLGPRSYFLSECWIGGKPIAASRVNLSLHPGLVEQSTNAIIQAFGMTRPRIESKRTAMVARAQPSDHKTRRRATT